MRVVALLASPIYSARRSPSKSQHTTTAGISQPMKTAPNLVEHRLRLELTLWCLGRPSCRAAVQLAIGSACHQNPGRGERKVNRKRAATHCVRLLVADR